MHKQTRYITTTLPYVNAEPHIGTVLEFVQADTLARYWRLMGHEVFFNTGTDEHGQKIAQKADEQSKDRQVYVDEYAAKFTPLKEALNLSCDNFIRTTSEQHKAAAEEIWRRCEARGDIYKKTYKGLYCVGDEAFVKESDLVNGCCPNHPGQAPVEIEEENYFFRLTNYRDQLLTYLEDERHTPTNWARNWALEFVRDGLEDISISRQKSRMDWGIPVPGDDEHVMYVWFDALTSYISTLGWPDESPAGDFQKFWVEGETLQLAGKDQMRFQSLIWQAMLLSADLPPTDIIRYHGFINIDGQKISKSIGNVISPYEVVDKYGTDATRYMLLRHIHPTDDGDITWEKMDEWYTAGLVNGLGNLTARITKMAEAHLDSPIDRPAAAGFPVEYTVALDKHDYMTACDYVWSRIQSLDEYITETEPFKLVKEDKPAAQTVIKELVHELYLIARLLFPIMPETNRIIKEAVLANQKPDNLFKRLND